MSHAAGHQRDRHGNPMDLEGYLARLEAPERAAWQMPDRVVRALDVRAGQTVADLGAGLGYFSLRLARRVGRHGRVYAVDVEPAILGRLRDRIVQQKLAQITPVLASPANPFLPLASCDRVLSVTAYHHYADRVAALRGMARLLRRGGRLAVIDFHKRETGMGPPPSERVSREDFLRDVKRARLRVVEEPTFLPHQYFFLLRG